MNLLTLLYIAVLSLSASLIVVIALSVRAYDQLYARFERVKASYKKEVLHLTRELNQERGKRSSALYAITGELKK